MFIKNSLRCFSVLLLLGNVVHASSEEEREIMKAPVRVPVVNPSDFGYLGQIRKVSKNGTPFSKMELALAAKPILVTNHRIIVKSLGGLIKYRYNQNCFQITVKAAKFCQEESDGFYDYYHIAQDGIFNPDKRLRLRTHLGFEAPILVSGYIMESYPVVKVSKTNSKDSTSVQWKPLGTNDKDQIIHLMKSSPDTTRNQTSYTSSLEVSLDMSVTMKGGGQGGGSGNSNGGGSGGGSGNLGVSGTLGSNITIGHAQERTLGDVEILNESLAEGHNARWNFRINNLDKHLEMASPASQSTFHPYVQWIWRVNRQEAIKNGIYQDTGDGKYCFTFNTALSMKLTRTRGHVGIGPGTHKAAPETFKVINTYVGIQIPYIN